MTRSSAAAGTRPGARPAALTRTDRLVLGFWLVNLAVFLHVVLLDAPLWLTYAYNGLLWAIGAALSYRSRTVRNVFVLGTVAGVVELGVDRFLVEYTGALVYPDGLPMLLSSPLYMPLAWAIAITHVGYVGTRLADIYGRRAAAVGPSLLAVAIVGFYEYGAFYAGIWRYVDAPLALLGHVPAFVVAAEAAMFALLHEFARVERPVLAGLGFGVVISVSYVASYFVFAALGG